MELENLNPVKQAAYSSDLAMKMERRGCTEGTRVGLLADLDHWLDDSTSPPVCWISGMAGTGKTSIAITFGRTAKERNLLAASFFCTRNSAECRNVRRIIPTIAYQLAGYLAPYRSALSKVLAGRTDFGSKHVLAQFAQLLKEPLQAMGPTIPNRMVVVIDGVDECEDRSGIGRLLDTFFQYSSTKTPNARERWGASYGTPHIRGPWGAHILRSGAQGAPCAPQYLYGARERLLELNRSSR